MADPQPPTPPTRYVITCEHASNAMPAEAAGWFDSATLDSHRAWDPGALDLAQALASALRAPLFAGHWSRLLIDLNRSSHHPKRVPYGANIPATTTARLHETVWQPYRTAVADAVAKAVAREGHCVHLSIHSFTPVLDGQTRQTEIGLLYDPARRPEQETARQLQQALMQETGLTVHRNQPYRGVADGHTTALRKEFDAGRYTGLEIEINQALVHQPDWPALCAQLARTLVATFDAKTP